ncbi:hypothetical protein ACJJTC_000724, partial [Scirpophaga incertulas]
KINATFLSCARPLVSWQVDVLGHSREFSSLAALMGYDGLFLNPISWEDELSRMRDRKLEFIWRGSDDLDAESDIFTHKLFDGYWPPPGFCFGSLCNDPLLVDSSMTFHNIAERIEEFAKSMNYRQAPHYKTRNVMVMMGQRYGYYDASIWFQNVDNLIYSVNRRAPNMQAVYSTPACYLKAVYEENYDKDSYAVGLYTSRPTLKYMAREIHRYLQIAKQLQVIARLGNNNKIFEDYNWIHGVFQDHNILSGEVRTHVVSYYVAKMTRSTKILVDDVLEKGFNKLRQNPIDTPMIRCRFNVSRCHCTDGPHMFIVIYNPLPWPVTMPVRLPMFNRDQVVYDPKGNKVPAGLMKIPVPVWKLKERNASASFELVFIAENLPPMGLRSYYFQRYQLGWDRPERSLIKKLKLKSEKNLISHTNTDQKNMPFYEPYYEYLDKSLVKRRIIPGNVYLRKNVQNVFYETTPKSYVQFITEASKANDTIVVNVTDGIDIIDSTSLNVRRTFNPINNTSSFDRTTTKIFNEDDKTANMKDAIQNSVFQTEDSKIKLQYESANENIATRMPVLANNMNDDNNYWKRYKCYKVTHTYIRNRYVRVNIDEDKKIVNVSLANGIRLPLSIQMLYYVSDDPDRLSSGKWPPGAYIFRTMDLQSQTISEDFETTVYKNNIVQEIHCRFSSWASIALRLYKDNPVLELDWLVGPVPIEDGLGKEVMIKYSTDLDNEGVFYTDSNGRQTMKRIRNTRATFNPVNKDPLACNLYPVTSKIYIEDLKRNVRFAVLNDRAQGGSSFSDGEINILLHRRLLTEDSAVDAVLNETDEDTGIVVRGQHYIYVSKADHKPYRIFEKKLAKEIELRPQILTSPAWGYGNKSKISWIGQRNEYSALKSKLPLGLHILSFEEWNEGTLLLRIENYLEKSDTVHTGVKKVILRDLFTHIDILDVKETTLAANLWLKDFVPLKWNREKFVKNFNEAYGTGKIDYVDDKLRDIIEVDVNIPVELTPQQIRTFVISYKYVE